MTQILWKTIAPNGKQILIQLQGKKKICFFTFAKSQNLFLIIADAWFMNQFSPSNFVLATYLNVRGVSKKFVHWCYIFLTTIDIDMILGDL